MKVLIKSASYLLFLIILICKASFATTPSKQPTLKIDLNEPPPIEQEQEQNISKKRKKFRSPQAHANKIERDRKYRAKFAIKRVNEALPSLNEEAKDKLLIQAEKKREQARARQQKSRGQRSERNKGQLLLKRAGLPPNVDLNNEPPAEDETETNNPTSFASFHEIDLDMAKVKKKPARVPLSPEERRRRKQVRDKRYAFSYTKKNLDLILPTLNAEEKNKFINQMNKRRETALRKQRNYRQNRRKRFEDGNPTLHDIQHRNKEKTRYVRNYQKKKLLRSMEAQTSNPEN